MTSALRGSASIPTTEHTSARRDKNAGVNDRNDGNSAGEPSGDSVDLRHDPYTGTSTYVVGNRQSRPSISAATTQSDCPFCPGGLEAPEPYRTRYFPNRWPALPDGRCEVVLYTPDHAATIPQIGANGMREVIDLWADRTQALAERADVDYVLVFENRGAEVGATIPHPHCQIYAYDHVPIRPRTLFGNGWKPEANTDLHIASHRSWTVFVPSAPAFPVAVTLAPVARRHDLVDLTSSERDDLAMAIVDTFDRLDRLFDEAPPTMMWINQRPSNGEFEHAWMSIEIVSPWRAQGLARYIAAAEIGAGEFFLPLVPEDVARSLRNLGR